MIKRCLIDKQNTELEKKNPSRSPLQIRKVEEGSNNNGWAKACDTLSKPHIFLNPTHKFF
jgi:hypothetical protein